MIPVLFQILFLVATCFFLATLPRFIWAGSPFFLALNQIQWFLHFPFRSWFRDHRSPWPRRIFFIGFPLWLSWMVIIYVLLFPVRLINSLYFNVLIFWSVNLRDQLADLWDPKDQGFRFLKAWPYYRRWLVDFPKRLFRFLFRTPTLLFQGLAMFLFDILWPSLTLFHGTTFQGASVPISQSGKWKVGYEDFVGTGIYFAISPSVAIHYASAHQPSVILARVSLTFVRPISTLAKAARKKAGISGGGDMISEQAGWFVGTLEHWRHDRGGWWEYCLVFPKKKGKFVKTWRIRPICILPADKKNKSLEFPQRLWKGIATWPGSKLDWIIWSASLMILLLFTLFGLDQTGTISLDSFELKRLFKPN